jgi:hypothetical protein
LSSPFKLLELKPGRYSITHRRYGERVESPSGSPTGTTGISTHLSFGGRSFTVFISVFVHVEYLGGGIKWITFGEGLWLRVRRKRLREMCNCGRVGYPHKRNMKCLKEKET